MRVIIASIILLIGINAAPIVEKSTESGLIKI